MRQESSMTKYLSVLDKVGKAVVCDVLRRHSQIQDAHPGMLPFISVRMVVECLDRQIRDYPKSRYLRGLKLSLSQDASVAKDQVSFVMYLSDAKVAKRFGPKPHLGRALPCLPKKRVTVGMRWNLPRKQFEPDDDVYVKPTVALTKGNSRKTYNKSKRTIETYPGQSHWHVSCGRKYQQAVMGWLVDFCR